MVRNLKLAFLFLLIANFYLYGQNQKFEEDLLPTSEGVLKITFFGHASLRIEWQGRSIYLDPVSRYADFSQLPKADLILITHEHGDHFDPAAIKALSHERTIVILTEKASSKLPSGKIMVNGDQINYDGILIEAVPAYNVVHKRNDGIPYHPKGEGNGYVLTLGGKKIYVAGDTENIPEMKNLKNVDVAFLPMNLPYTMTPEMVAEAARLIKPKILYPYHYGDTDTQRLIDLLKDEKDIEIRIRQMK